jgi:hypothetical protein
VHKEDESNEIGKDTFSDLILGSIRAITELGLVSYFDLWTVLVPFPVYLL